LVAFAEPSRLDHINNVLWYVHSFETSLLGAIFGL
jgi:hypothetical protein